MQIDTMGKKGGPKNQRWEETWGNKIENKLRNIKDIKANDLN